MGVATNASTACQRHAARTCCIVEPSRRRAGSSRKIVARPADRHQVHISRVARLEAHRGAGGDVRAAYRMRAARSNVEQTG